MSGSKKAKASKDHATRGPYPHVAVGLLAGRNQFAFFSALSDFFGCPGRSPRVSPPTETRSLEIPDEVTPLVPGRKGP